MQHNLYYLIGTILFAALLPVTTWGYGFYGGPADGNYLPYAGSQRNHQYAGYLRFHTGETRDGYHVRVNIEGLHPEDIQIYIRHNRLVLQVEQGDQYGLSKPGNHSAAIWSMHFRNQLRLPYDADWMRMTTSTANGVMDIYIPRRQ